MSDTTPESTPEPGSPDSEASRGRGAAEPAATEPATSPAASASAEPHDTDPDMDLPPSEPVSARGHLNRGGDAETATPATPAPEEPAKAIEPEPVVATEDDVAAAVARTHGEPGASAAGSATMDTASPAESATPVIVAAEAARLRDDEAAREKAPTGLDLDGREAVAGATAGGAAAASVAEQRPAPVYPQRPAPPKRRSNRGIGILIALVGTILFAVLWIATVAAVGYAVVPGDRFLAAFEQTLTRYIVWVPAAAFFIGMVVLVQILNRARWWAYILCGLFVAAFVYFAAIGATLIDDQYWSRNPGEVAVILNSAWLSPFAVLAGVIAREASMWTGAWLAARGRKLRARNADAQAEYEQQVADAQNQAVAAYASSPGY